MHPRREPTAALVLGALGVVFGDIGTSPLYALRECFSEAHGLPVVHDNVLGLLSLITWSLLVIVSFKYVVFVLRADNRGEGGALALLALVRRTAGGRESVPVLVAAGLFGAALLYGDGMITPAISVLSAIEGLNVATPVFQAHVVPMTLVILVGLFAVQSHGTARIGAVFGPVVLAWFTVLAVLGVSGIVRHPTVLGAVSPHHAVRFFEANGLAGFFVLSGAFLVVTGAEALYADMGHFGPAPIRRAWFVVVLPALLLNYYGQGALLLDDPTAVENPFFRLAPSWAVIPLVVLAAAATVIASQAMISGAFSLTRQAVQLGYLPRMSIVHTSSEEIGQIYVPIVNWGLMISTCGLVLAFKTSSALAGAYGIAVAGTMVITTILVYSVARHRWHWSRAKALLIMGPLLVVDVTYFSANATKILAGGWFPLAVGLIVFTVLTTWRTGRRLATARLNDRSLPLDAFVTDLEKHPLPRVPGVAVFMTGNQAGTPTTLLHNIKNNRMLHERVVLLSVTTEEVPHVPRDKRVAVEPVGEGIFRLSIRYGFMDEPNIPAALEQCRAHGLEFPPGKTSYFFGHYTLVPTRTPGMAFWRKRLHAWMSRNAQRATAYFQVPPNRVVELGAQVEF